MLRQLQKIQILAFGLCREACEGSSWGDDAHLASAVREEEEVVIGRERGR